MRDDTAGSLAALLTAELGEADRAEVGEADDLEAWLERELADARAAWPTIAIPDAIFLRCLASRLRSREAASAIRKFHLSDLYLACACSRFDPRALAAFDEHYFPQVDRALRRMQLGDGPTLEVRDALRDQLFFPAGSEAPLIAGYSGRGALSGWVRSVAVHAGLKMRRRKSREQQLEDSIERVIPSSDPELLYLKTLYVEVFDDALVKTFRSLPLRDRNLLRHYYFDRLSIDELGRLHRVHRATAARWVADVRESLHQGVRAAMTTRLALQGSALESILRLIRSQVQDLPPPAAWEE